MLVCWDAEKMNSLTEPGPNDADEEDEGFPWLDDLRARGIWVTGDQLAPPRRARSVRVRGGEALSPGTIALDLLKREGLNISCASAYWVGGIHDRCQGCQRFPEFAGGHSTEHTAPWAGLPPTQNVV